MKLAIVTDMWYPMVNRIVTTVQQLQQQLQTLGFEVLLLHPSGHGTRQSDWIQQLDVFKPDAIHLATEGRLGWCARQYCVQRGYAFSSSYHGCWPESMHSRYRVPLAWSYAWLRFFHRASSAVLVPLNPVLHKLNQQGFKHLRAWTYAVDNQVYPFADSVSLLPEFGGFAHPVSLFVGSLNEYSNVEAFLALDVPGTKVVCGEGPLAQTLQNRYPAVRWMGAVSHSQLVQCYHAADVVVVPALQARFSMVMLEALSCGVPVLAHPTQAAREILGTPAQGGVVHHDLQSAWYQALSVPRYQARAKAQCFSWQYAVRMFIRHLVPKQDAGGRSLNPAFLGLSRNCHQNTEKIG
jgi:glycosyltransferase involved in cell wall biosynthesis